jgi:chlorobactene glucosyltransferase
VLVPARNEAHQIARCLESLSSQTYGNIEVILLDDYSEDDTADVAKGLGFCENSWGKCQLMRGQTMPRGWAGKPWACYQLSRQATGDFLLFTDADTVHHETSVESAVVMALEKRTQLLSVWPHQVTVTWAEKLIIPMSYLLGLAFVPYWFLRIAQRSHKSFRWVPRAMWRRMGAANGQYMLFTRDAYKALGSHQVVKNNLVEDVALGREVTKRIPKGWRIINVDGHRVVECRMYREFLEVWEGSSKNFRPAFEGRPLEFLGVGVILAVTMFLPFVWFIVRGQPWLVTLQAQLILLIRLVLTVRFHTSWSSLALHPFAMLLSFVIALNSWRQSMTGKITWKRRQYDCSPGQR